MFSSVYLAGEDEVTLALGRKVVGLSPPLHVYREDNTRGFGRLRTKVRSFQQMVSHGLPVFLLTDLDRAACPSALIDDWLGCVPNRGFLFRVCVRAGEAWMLADRQSIAEFLKVRVTAIPSDPEKLRDPKRELIQIAQRSPRAIRDGLTPVGSATIGPEHNSLLSRYARDHWSPSEAAKCAPSLARCVQRVRLLADMCR